MLILQNLSYIHPNKEVLFSTISFTINLYSKTALIGNNGAGKSTLLKIIAGELQPSGGQLHLLSKPYYVPQIFGQYDQLTIAQALGIDSKIKAPPATQRVLLNKKICRICCANVSDLAPTTMSHKA